MSLLKNVLKGAFDWVGDAFEEASRNPLETRLTMGRNTQIAAWQKALKDFQYRNGVRQMEQRSAQMQIEADKQAKTDAATKLAGETMLASVPYASAFSQPNPSLLNQQQSRKTILGSF